jgi:outer membrane protein insertion porin family
MTTDISWQIRQDTTNRGPLLFEGSNMHLQYDLFGAMGGQYHYNQFGVGYDHYQTLFSDLLDRRTVLTFHMDAGYILNDAPFFNRFYGGGQGSMRGFEFRGVGPRAGRDLDPIGGDFSLIGSLGVNYPIFGDTIRGVVFTDFGTVESDIRIHTIRDSVGAGVRVTIPQLGFNRPLAFDIAFPTIKEPQDIRQIFSFGLGIER